MQYDKESKQPFFSIIIPVYNTEDFLEECLESVLKQTLGDYEAIMVDDGSKDSSGLICDYYANLDRRFQVYHKSNEGPLLTRIYGIERSVGAYLIFLDSDDMLRVDTLEIIKNAAVSWNADLILFHASQRKDFRTTWRDLKLPVMELLEKEPLYKFICEGTLMNNIVTKCCKREDFSNTDMLKQYHYVYCGEDLVISMEVITNAKIPVFVNERLYFYRTTTGSMTHVYRESSYRSDITVGMVLREYAKKWEGGEEKWLPLIFDRNLTSCINAIKYEIFNCDSKEKRQLKIKEIRQDQFFITSYREGHKNKLSIFDRILGYAVRTDLDVIVELVSGIILNIKKVKGIVKILIMGYKPV